MSSVRLILSLEIGLAAVLSFLSLGEKSFWYDEVCSIAIAQDWSQMWRTLLGSEANMWLYYVLLNRWMQLGDTEFAIRSLSAIFAVLTVPVIYRIGAHLWGSRVGLIAAFLLTISSAFVQFAQEARSYSLTLFLTACATLFFVNAVSSGSRKYWLGYAAVESLAIYAHFFAALVPIGQIGALILFRRRETPWKNLFVCAALAAVLLLPLVIFQPLDSPQINYLVTPNANDLLRLLEFYTSYRDALLLAYSAASLLALTCFIRRPSEGDQVWPVTLMLGWLLLPIAITFAVAILVQPIFALRYMLIFLAPFLILVAAGFAKIRPNWLLAAVLLIVAFFSTRALRHLYVSPKQDWRSTVALVGSQKGPQDAIIFFPYYASVPFEYYWRKTYGQRPLSHVEISSAPYTIMPGGVPDPDLAQVESISGSHDRIWWVTQPVLDDYLGHAAQGRVIERALAKDYRLVFNELLIEVRVKRYERIATPPSSQGP